MFTYIYQLGDLFFSYSSISVSYIHTESGYSSFQTTSLLSNTIHIRPTSFFYTTAKMKATLVTFTLFAATFGAPVRRQAGGNLQTFTGALGGIAATPVENTGDATRPFSVKGDTFVNLAGALTRSCDQQFNACANAANGGDATLSTDACTTQKSMYPNSNYRDCC